MPNPTIILTGAAGFIGSYMAGFLNEMGYDKLILVDDFSEEEKTANYNSKKFITKVERINLFDWLSNNASQIDFVFHLGARTDTTEFDYSIHEELNVEYSKKIWEYCTNKNVPLIYASSAATYGSGEQGYSDDHSLVEILQPLNPYGVSKNEFDKWALKQEKTPAFWAGLKFFNVFGPNEYHKGRMASVIFHAFNQIRTTGRVKLFRSHKPGFKDGEQLRDFIYVKDVAEVMYWLFRQVMEKNPVPNGLYNLGTGRARTFKDLVNAIFISLGKQPVVDFIDTPEDIRDKYQYYTEADMNKLRGVGYTKPFTSLEDGVADYVKQYLLEDSYY